jgi:hypothetical protein
MSNEKAITIETFNLEPGCISLCCGNHEHIQLNQDGKVLIHGKEVKCSEEFVQKLNIFFHKVLQKPLPETTHSKSPKLSIHIYDDDKCIVQEHMPNNEPDIIWEPLMLDISLRNNDHEFKTYHIETTMVEIDDYWVDQNGNKWSVDIYSREDAIKSSDSLSCCTDCINCRHCSFCTGCENCVNCFQCIDCKKCESCTRCDSCYNCFNVDNNSNR